MLMFNMITGEKRGVVTIVGHKHKRHTDVDITAMKVGRTNGLLEQLVFDVGAFMQYRQFPIATTKAKL